MKKLVLKIDSLKSWDTLKDTINSKWPLEFIVGTKSLTRVSELNLVECQELAKQIKNSGYRVILEWDILMTEDQFQVACSLFKKLELDLFDVIRVQDPGVLMYLKNNNFKLPIHLIVDNGNHNLVGLNHWLTFWPKMIERLIISAQLPSDLILKFRDKLDVDLEVYGAGEVLLFYTPRFLVTPLYGQEVRDDSHQLKVQATSEESAHKGFPVIENNHGTFMFNTKEQFILDEYEKLNEICSQGNVWVRVDFSQKELERHDWKNLFKCFYYNDHDSAIELKTKCRGTIKSFFRSNKTDVLFKKLKNNKLPEKNKLYLGEIVDVKKKRHLGLHLRNTTHILSLGDDVVLYTPEGKVKKSSVTKLCRLDDKAIESAQEGQVVFINHVSGVSIKTQVFKDSGDINGPKA